MKTQIVTKEDNWLYYSYCDDQFRLFEKEISLPDDDPFWPECTDAEKQEYESKHPQPQSESEESNGTEAE